jgi:WD40 repeat protein
MRLLHEQVLGGIVIAALVAAGMLVADEPELRRHADELLFARASRKALTSVTVSRLELSADGNTMLTQSRGNANAWQTIAIHNLKNSTAFIPHFSRSFYENICHASLSPEGNSIVLATHTGELWWIDIETSSATELIKVPATPFTCTAIGSSGRIMAGATTDGVVRFFDPTRGIVRTLSPPHHSLVTRLCFSSNSERLLGVRENGSMIVWETTTGNVIGDHRPPFSSLPNAVLLPGGHQILCSTKSGKMQLRDALSGDEVWCGTEGSIGELGISTLDVSRSGTLAAWGIGIGHRIVVWDMNLLQKKLEIENPSLVLNLKFLPDGKSVAVAGREGIVRIYDTDTGREIRRIDVAHVMDTESRT